MEQKGIVAIRSSAVTNKIKVLQKISKPLFLCVKNMLRKILDNVWLRFLFPRYVQFWSSQSRVIVSISYMYLEFYYLTLKQQNLWRKSRQGAVMVSVDQVSASLARVVSSIVFLGKKVHFCCASVGFPRCMNEFPRCTCSLIPLGCQGWGYSINYSKFLYAMETVIHFGKMQHSGIQVRNKEPQRLTPTTPFFTRSW